MIPLLSAKGGDIATWRGVEDFASSYRQTLLVQAASVRCGSAEAVFSEAHATLETAMAAHKQIMLRLGELSGDLQTATSPRRIKELTAPFYRELYRHFDLFRSAPAFYQMSMTFLRQAGAAIVALAADHPGVKANHLPEMALIAVGPAGRREYSPFCPMQILLVHGEVADAHYAEFNQFCQTLHGGFEDAGLQIDPVITPRNARWRGTLPEWRQRSEEGLHSLSDSKTIDLCRLVDQYQLYPPGESGLATEFRQSSCALLSGSRPTLAHLVVRMTSISNGLSFIGRLKLERSGTERGMFNLLDHGLLPFSAALSALSLIRKSTATGSCERIHDLLKRSEIDVELAERMLATWHTLQELRLRREQSFHFGPDTGRPLFLNPDEMTAEQRQSLKKNLESVAAIQHHVVTMFSGTEE